MKSVKRAVASRGPIDEPATIAQQLRAIREAIQRTPQIVRLVLDADVFGAVLILGAGFLLAVIPPAAAYVGKLIVDNVVLALQETSAQAKSDAIRYVLVEFVLMGAATLLTRVQTWQRTLLGAKLGYRLNTMILEKALTLELLQFENPEVYDKLQNARREAGSRPLNLFMNTVEIGTNVLTLVSFGFVLLTFSFWALVALVMMTLPAFFAEARFSAQAFRLFSWRAPEGRRMRYLELLLTRDEDVKEVKLFGLGDLLVRRYRAIYEKFYGEERQLATRRAAWGFSLGLLSTTALYACYVWVVVRTVNGHLSVGDLTMYLVVFRQGQGALRNVLKSLGSTYEDNLFMSNLFDFLSLPTTSRTSSAGESAQVPAPLDGVPTVGFVLEHVSFRYPGAENYALRDVNLHIGPTEKLAIVGENGAGKTTLIKILTGLYAPTEGRVLLDGVPLASLSEEARRERFGVLLQDFVRYQFKLRDNIGLGRPEQIEDLSAIERAAEKGGAKELISSLREGYEQQLGRWFDGGVELSTGGWQKIAVARAFMRDAKILILDEPTASLDAEAEHALFLRLRALTEGSMAILISHRFSTVRLADRILVLKKGVVEELGSHDELLARSGRYAQLFRIQAQGYL